MSAYNGQLREGWREYEGSADEQDLTGRTAGI